MATKERRLERRVGAITLGGLVLLIAGVLWGKGLTDNLDKVPLIIAFDDATGITTNTPVYYHGVQIGSVSSLSVSREGAMVKAHISGEFDLREDASATLRIMELTGGKKIELNPGVASSALNERAIVGLNQGDIGEIFSLAVSIASDVGPMMRRADSLLVALNGLLSDPALQNGVRQTVAEFSEAGRRTNRLIAASEPEITSTLRSLGALSGELNDLLERNGPTVESAISTSSNAANAADELLTEARQSLAQIDALVLELQSVGELVKNGEGVIPALLNDRELKDELAQTLKTLRTMVRKLDERGMNVNVEVGHER